MFCCYVTVALRRVITVIVVHMFFVRQVLLGKLRPPVPRTLYPPIQKMLEKMWSAAPESRPTMVEVLDVLSAAMEAGEGAFQIDEDDVDQQAIGDVTPTVTSTAQVTITTTDNIEEQVVYSASEDASGVLAVPSASTTTDITRLMEDVNVTEI